MSPAVRLIAKHQFDFGVFDIFTLSAYSLSFLACIFWIANRRVEKNKRNGGRKRKESREGSFLKRIGKTSLTRKERGPRKELSARLEDLGI